MNLPTAGTEPCCAMNDAVRLDAVSFGYGRESVVRDVSLSVPQGAFVTLLGPSGCGKTTLLRLIGGYLSPSHGRIVLHEKDVTSLPAHARDVGMVFQNYALFPHLSVRRNVAFGLEVRRQHSSIVREQVESALDRVGLAVELRDRLPRQLSGGQQQRVALARALAFGPSLLLLDEPLASLDRHLREQLRAELRMVHAISRVSTLMVTHDQDEALAISDFVGVMRAGRLLQFGEPRELYNRPRTPFVARFLGDANLITCDQLGMSQQGIGLVRPEQVRLGGDTSGRVVGVSYRGTALMLDVQCDAFPLKVSCPADTNLSVGDAITVDIPRGSLWIVPEPDGES